MAIPPFRGNRAALKKRYTSLIPETFRLNGRYEKVVRSIESRLKTSFDHQESRFLGGVRKSPRAQLPAGQHSAIPVGKSFFPEDSKESRKESGILDTRRADHAEPYRAGETAGKLPNNLVC
jgi:hypothetical protein